MLLKDKIVIISGIGPGLGVKLAVEAAREGARGLVIGARSKAHLVDAEQRIRALGVNAEVLSVETDIRDAGQCQRQADTDRHQKIFYSEHFPPNTLFARSNE